MNNKPQKPKSPKSSKPGISPKLKLSNSTKSKPTSKPSFKKIAVSTQPSTKTARPVKKSSLREVFSELNDKKPAHSQSLVKDISKSTPSAQLKYYIIFKPFGMMTQFSRENEKPTLADIKFDFPKDAYPVGRLDADTEGLLLLSNDTSLNSKLLNPVNGHKRTYLAQLDGTITEDAAKQLRKGVSITIDGKAYKTLPAEIKLVKEEPVLPPRNPPIRVRANIPTSWVELTLIEGKNHQVRKMCAKAGFPVLRLVRIKIGNLTLGNLQPNKVKELSEQEIESLVNI
ncbi:MAG: pseudouridine synthase [Opitutaceae bacterium]|nr:pseudouridine synthase [Cytophagales bacterium]